jgi:hypothetical protein
MSDHHGRVRRLSLVAIPGYYVAYGLLASMSGANSSGSSGYGGGSADGTVTWSVTELAPAWFTFSTGLLRVLFLAAAAIANVAVLGDVRARARSHSQDERSRAVGT